MERILRTSDFDQLKRETAQAIEDASIAKCPKCGMSWLEEVEVKQFDKLQQIILGQKSPSLNSNKFYILRCVKCGEILEPNILLSGQDQVRKSYDRFLSEVEAKLP